MFFHELTMTNVGPFAGTISVDFARVAQSGLFLLEGPTGAGKSTILDSIVFALYGDVGVPHASTERMRSSFAQPHEISEVTLVFETSAGVFRIQRTPAYDRLKKSGQGTTRQNSTVKLWRLSDPQSQPVDAPISTRHGEAESEILRIVGLNRVQFVQTILLPQGEFANFLRAKPESRRDLLQKIFGTDLYDRIAIELDNERRIAHGDRAKAQEKVGHALTAFLATIEASPEQSDVLRAANLDSLPDLASSMVRHLTADAHITESAVDRCEAESIRTHEALRVGELQAQRQERKARLVARQLVLDRGHVDERAKRTLLQELEMVERVAPTHESLVRAQGTATSAEDKCRTMVELFEAKFAVAVDDPTKQGEAIRLHLQSLEPVVHLEQQLPQLLIDLSKQRLRRDRLEANLADLESEKDLLPARVTQLSADRDAARSLTAEIPLLKSAVLDVARRLASSRTAVGLADDSAVASQRVVEAELLAKAANSEFGLLQQQRIDGIAGELATALVDGAPCMVCGALEHPQPNRGKGLVDPSDLAQANERVDVLVASLSEAVDGLKGIEIDLATAIAAGGEQSVPELEIALDLAETTLTRSQEASSQLLSIEAELTAAQDAMASITASIDRTKEDLSECAHEVKVLNDQRLGATTQCEAVREDFATVEDKVATLAEQAHELDVVARASGASRDAKNGLDAALENWNRAEQTLVLSGASPLDELLATQDVIATTRDDIAELDREHAIVDAGLAEIAEQAADDISEMIEDIPSLEVLTSAAALASKARDEAKAKHQSVCALIARALTTVDTLLLALKRSDAVKQSTAEIIRLSEIANATSLVNGPRISLPTYVLMSRFHDVIAAANTRLQAMSDGRFTLVHSFEKESQGRKSGLGIVVRDHHGECDRAPGDLSGGETFYTSLALALGLADVVTAEAGGVDLGTLFIDEGFGALDSETLDSVLTEIARLQQGGRVVGVVSHVDELKQRISDRIEVRRLPSGSSTITIVA